MSQTVTKLKHTAKFIAINPPKTPINQNVCVCSNEKSSANSLFKDMQESKFHATNGMIAVVNNNGNVIVATCHQMRFFFDFVNLGLLHQTRVQAFFLLAQKLFRTQTNFHFCKF